MKEYIWQHCGENDCRREVSKKIDPALKLYRNCPLMLVENTNVPDGQANGSRVFLKDVTLKTGEAAFVMELPNGARVQTVYASQVDSVVVEHECDMVRPRIFSLKPKNWTFRIKIGINNQEVPMNTKGYQLPLVSNGCTTGHKLQGCSLDKVFVESWSYSRNWPYVILSRVRTMKGLYIRNELITDLRKYALPEQMLKMLEYFRLRCPLKPLSSEVYDDLSEKSEALVRHGGF